MPFGNRRFKPPTGRAGREPAAASRRVLVSCVRSPLVGVQRLVAAIEAGTDAPAVAERLRTLERQKATLVQQLADATPLPRLEPRVVASHLAEWRRLLRADVMNARAVLDRVLAGRIVFTPTDDDEYVFECMTRYDRLFAGAALKLPPTDEMPMWMPSSDDVPDDVRDAMRYEAVLQRAHRRLDENRKNAEQNQISFGNLMSPKRSGVPGRI
jgi:hypothetical protein